MYFAPTNLIIRIVSKTSVFIGSGFMQKKFFRIRIIRFLTVYQYLNVKLNVSIDLDQ